MAISRGYLAGGSVEPPARRPGSAQQSRPPGAVEDGLLLAVVASECDALAGDQLGGPVD